MHEPLGVGGSEGGRHVEVKLLGRRILVVGLVSFDRLQLPTPPTHQHLFISLTIPRLIPTPVLLNGDLLPLHRRRYLYFEWARLLYFVTL